MENLSDNFLVPAKFYGVQSQSSRRRPERNKINVHESKFSACYSAIPFDLKRLLGPTSTWKVFKKQSEVLNFVKSRNSGVMAFVFQQSNGERLFLAAHPRWLWYYDSKKHSSRRCSYEIIPEFTVCKLYFDLEFDIPLNQDHNGVLMVETFIKIICYYVKARWKLETDRKCVIDLDSSTALKFSRHLIFNIQNAAFRDNYNVGKFVKYVCNEIKCCAAQIDEDFTYCNEFMKDCSIRTLEVMSLKVTNSKGLSVLFCDEGVYTKNRHFRVFKSTKLGKNAPLVLSNENLYQPKDSSFKDIEEQIFLDSLITHVPNDSIIKILYFSDDAKRNSDSALNLLTKSSNDFVMSENCCTSPFPKIDQFIAQLVHPGRIWRNNYFQTSNIIVYDIIGYRYCGNIGRQHRSNNIKQVVDINNRCVYQKCYDPDCLTYRSVPTQLPPEIQFYLDDELDSYISENDTSFQTQLYSAFDDDIYDKEFAEVVDIIEQISCYAPLTDETDTQ